MQNAVFIINGRFLVNVERNEIIDHTTGDKNRLEPRLMKLLNLLVTQQGNIVKREVIIKEIWDDYPGANEGLNQAISFLRKVLRDEHKVIIQTQPKTGYSLHALITPAKQKLPLVPKRHLLFIIGAVISALLLLLMWAIYKRQDAVFVIKRQSNKNHDAEISRIDSINQAGKMKLLLKDTLGPAANGDSLRAN